MYFNIHSHIRPISEKKDVTLILNLNVPDYIYCCGLDLQNTNYSIGIHPWKINPDLLSEHLRFIEENIQFECIKAVGECGLDKLTETPWDLQLRAFTSQIAISEKNKKPLIIHCVKAFDELIALKKDFNPQQAWIIHGFRGKPQQMQQLVSQGLYLSFGIHFNTDALKEVPDDKFFLETDDSETSVKQVYTEVSKVKGINLENLILQVEKNFAEIF